MECFWVRLNLINLCWLEYFLIYKFIVNAQITRFNLSWLLFEISSTLIPTNVFELHSVMNVVIFWDIAPCSPYVNRSFGGCFYLYFQGGKSAEQETRRLDNKSASRDNSYCLATCYRLVCCSADFLPWRWRWYVPLKMSVYVRTTRHCNPEDATCIITAVRSSNPICILYLHKDAIPSNYSQILHV
jgi:hypothetical protein